MKKVIILTVLIKTIVVFIGSAQSISFENLEYKVDSLVALQHSNGQPGGVVGILSGDDVVLKKTFGIKDLEQNKPVDEKTLFDIASTAKQFTALAILMLEEQGKLNLDDDIIDYLPGFPGFEHKVTIRNLIQHTSGIPSTDVLRLFAGWSLDETWTQQDEIELIQRYSQLNFEPNEKHVYSNAGYSLLATIVEEVSGMRFSEFLAENIFSPLQMNNSLVYDERYQEKELLSTAIGYRRANDGFIPFSTTEDFNYGGGSIYTSLDDMVKWGQALFSSAILSDNVIERISYPYNTLNDGDTLDYTYGFYSREYKGIRMVDHSGGTLGFRSQFMIFPEENLLVFVLLNNEGINSRRLAMGIVDFLLIDKMVEEEVAQRTEIELDSEAIKPFEGIYRLPEGMELSFFLEKDTFWLSIPGSGTFQLFAESENEFFLKAFNAQSKFVKDDKGNVNEMIWREGGKDYTSPRVKEPLPPTVEELEKYAGKYHQAELDAKYSVKFEDGTLTIYTPETFKKYLGFNSVNLNNMRDDIFVAERWLGMIEFTRNDEGEISGLIFHNVGRLQNLKLVKLQ